MMIDFIMWYLITGVVSFCILYTLFAFMMTVKNHYDHDNFHWAVRYPMGFVFLLGYIGDVLWNIIFGSVLFAQFPYWDKDQTLTHRLNRIYREEPEGSRRRNRAIFLCRYLLNPLDPHHCGDR